MPVRVEFKGAPQLVAGLKGLSDLSEYDRANILVGITVRKAATTLAPSNSGALAGSVKDVVTTRGVHVGSNSPYARWFHVPNLSEGKTQYAKVNVPTRKGSRSYDYGRRIPDMPFIIAALKLKEKEVVAEYIEATGDLIDRAMRGVG